MSEATGTFQSILPENCAITRSRSHSSGLLALPIAGPPGTPPEIVRVHGGMDMLDISFAAGQMGGPMSIPHPDLGDGNSVLLGGSQVAALPMEQQQGDHYWDLSGSYTYVCKQLIGLAAQIPTGVMPFESQVDKYNFGSTPAAMTIPPTILSKNIVGGDQTTPKLTPQVYIPKL
jgi:hypothetical protein